MVDPNSDASQHFDHRYILKFSCPDKMGIVAAVANFFAQQDCNILESAQFYDESTNHFFMRTVYGSGPNTPDLESLSASFTHISKQFSMACSIHDQATKPKVLILVSKPGHCLNDLLYRVTTGALNIDVVGIVSNHLDQRSLAEFHNLDYHYLPITPETKRDQEVEILDIIKRSGAELIVLARYMQILTPEMCEALSGRCINIHHSFLPGFKGAKPYHQAYTRGVKLIGATAHYVTPNLDEGPIIEQETDRVSHANAPSDLERIGSDLENVVLARAVRSHIEQRVLIHGDR
ncbi:MAG: formyltetrahydrofolate deformylase, partial [Alphaproteobacteria bacterium]|nr:formyltetrahydrofolate deformylase [Alphaproteobacteria bacterium]